MDYRYATLLDFPALTEFINSTEYFNPMNPLELGGHWIIAIKDGEVHGTVWFFGAPPHMYVDYWAASHPRIAIKLMNCLETQCKASGFRYVHGIIASDNDDALRLMTEAHGALAAGSYHRVYKEIELHGQQEDGKHSNHTAAERAGITAP